ncbi:MAG: S-layer homology domain-containing protein, partial [Candidatus Peregrinibacteria bacterium]
YVRSLLFPLLHFELKLRKSLKILFLAAGIEVKKNLKNSFSDIKANDWFYDFVTTGAEVGVVNGYLDKTFKPNNPVTRNEFAIMVCKTFEL